MSFRNLLKITRPAATTKEPMLPGAAMVKGCARVSANPIENGDLVPVQRPDGATLMRSQRTAWPGESVSLSRVAHHVCVNL